MIDELRRCDKCGTETYEAVGRCPRCGRRLFSARQVRRLGWVQLIIGLFLVGLMGTITFNLAPSLLRASGREGGARFTGTPEQGRLILGLFGIIIVFGLTSIANGLWQITTGRRNKWIIYFSFGLIVLVVIAAWFVQKALSG